MDDGDDGREGPMMKLSRETPRHKWTHRARFARIAHLAVLGALAFAVLGMPGAVAPLSETLTATNIVGTATITTPSYVVSGGTSPTVTVCNASPPTAVAPVGSLCLDTTGSKLFQSSGGGTWTQVGGAAGVSFSFFGDASDGNAVLDGVATITLSNGVTMAPAGSVYTAPQDLNFNNLTINAGIVLRSGGYTTHVADTLTDNGAVQNNGADASGATGGAGGTGAWLGNGGNGGNGAVNTGTATAGGSVPHAVRSCTAGTAAPGSNSNGANGGTCQGGGGGDLSGGGGGAGGTTTYTTSTQSDHDILLGVQGHGIGDSAALTGGSGGGGGRGDGFTGTGGGGGGGGGWVIVAAKTITGTGVIQARGGAGANGVVSPGSGGGGGGGGTVIIITNSSTPLSTTNDTNGGAKGVGVGGGFDGGTGGAGILRMFHG